MTVSFKQLKDPMTQQVSDTMILMTDEQGVVWTVPLGAGHRFEQELEDWKAAGNTVLPPD